MLKAGDIISIRPKSTDLSIITESIDNSQKKRYNWLDVDKKTLTGKYLNAPALADIPENINVQLIVELYSK